MHFLIELLSGFLQDRTTKIKNKQKQKQNDKQKQKPEDLTGEEISWAILELMGLFRMNKRFKVMVHVKTQLQSWKGPFGRDPKLEGSLGPVHVEEAQWGMELST